MFDRKYTPRLLARVVCFAERVSIAADCSLTLRARRQANQTQRSKFHLLADRRRWPSAVIACCCKCLRAGRVRTAIQQNEHLRTV